MKKLLRLLNEWRAKGLLRRAAAMHNDLLIHVAAEQARIQGVRLKAAHYLTASAPAKRVQPQGKGLAALLGGDRRRPSNVLKFDLPAQIETIRQERRTA